MMMLESAYDVLQARIRDIQSFPGQRRDPHVVALVGSAGAMAGCLSAAFVARLEAHGLLRIFDFSIASSAGAIVNAYFVCGQAASGSFMIPTFLSSKGFENDGRSRRYIDWRRGFHGTPIWDLDMCVEGLMFGKIPLNINTLKQAIPSYCLVSYEDQRSSLLKLTSDRNVLKVAISGTCRIPLIIDREIQPNPMKLWDGSFVASSPVSHAFELGATHCLVTRNGNLICEQPNLLVKTFAAFVKTRNPMLARTILKSYKSNADMIGRFANDSRVFWLVPEETVGPFEQNQERLWDVMKKAYLLAGSKLNLVNLPYPKGWC
jgi:predicted patatin/cPLA2 family phospholipase